MNINKWVIGFFIILPAFCIIPFLLIKDAISAAWTQGKGQKQLILNSFYYGSYQFYNEDSKVTSSPNKFTKLEFNPYFEYGFTDNITIGINPSFQKWTFEKSRASEAVFDFRQCGISTSFNRDNLDVYIAESEIFFRTKLYSNNNFVFSLQPLIKTPCMTVADGSIEFIDDTMDFEIKALFGYGFVWDPHIKFGFSKVPFAGQNHFINIDAAYRKRNKQFADQIKVDATAGLRYKKDLLILGQVFSTFSNGDEIIRGVISNNGLVTQKDEYYTVKVQGSIVQQMTRNTSVQFGAFHEIAGKNSGKGLGVSMSFWYNF
jgi:hypothetical protein